LAVCCTGSIRERKETCPGNRFFFNLVLFNRCAILLFGGIEIWTPVFVKFRDLGSGGYDFMEWVSNVTSTTQIPVMKLPHDAQLVSVSYVWMGDTALSIGVGEQVAFSIGTIPNGSNPVIGNYTSIASLFDLTNADDGTYANNVIDIGQDFNQGDILAVVGQETGTVTPNNGELGISLLFKSI